MFACSFPNLKKMSWSSAIRRVRLLYCGSVNIDNTNKLYWKKKSFRVFGLLKYRYRNLIKLKNKIRCSPNLVLKELRKPFMEGNSYYALTFVTFIWYIQKGVLYLIFRILKNLQLLSQSIIIVVWIKYWW